MFSSNWKRKWYFSEIFHTQFCFDMFYAVKSSEVELNCCNLNSYLHYCKSDYTALLFVSEYCLIVYSITFPWIYVVNFNDDLSF